MATNVAKIFGGLSTANFRKICGSWLNLGLLVQKPFIAGSSYDDFEGNQFPGMFLHFTLSGGHTFEFPVEGFSKSEIEDLTQLPLFKGKADPGHMIMICTSTIMEDGRWVPCPFLYFSEKDLLCRHQLTPTQFKRLTGE